ncbi:MAG: hypothetical protein L0027_08070, partial [Candidatus Rokubacteria bacterium]|nr:hypothetical protein [Candidatus Rokubacteria bacterium]
KIVTRAKRECVKALEQVSHDYRITLPRVELEADLPIYADTPERMGVLVGQQLARDILKHGGRPQLELPIGRERATVIQRAPEATFTPTKGVEDIELLPATGGYEASFDIGKETLKVGTDDKGKKIEFGGEYSLPTPSFPPVPFTVYGVPCFLSGGIEAKIGTSGSVGGGQKSVKAYGVVSGKVLVSAGKASFEKYEVGIGGGGELSLTLELVEGVEDESGIAINTNIPLKLTLFASARAKFQVAGGSYGPEVKKTIAQWTLGTLQIVWSKGGGKQTNLSRNPDTSALTAAFEQAAKQAAGLLSAKVADEVEKRAPEPVKKASEDAAKWAAESKGGGVVTDIVDKVAPESWKDTAESIVKTVGGGDWETSKESTERVQKEMEVFNSSLGTLHAYLDHLGLRGELRPYRSADEYNTIIDTWRVESEEEVKGRETSRQWKTKADSVAATARERKAKKDAQKRAEEEAKRKAAEPPPKKDIPLPPAISGEVKHRVRNFQHAGSIPYQGITYTFSYNKSSKVITVVPGPDALPKTVVFTG